MLKALVIVCILLPLAELYLLITLGHHIGLGSTLALLAVSAVLGSLIARRQGEKVFRNWREAMAGGGVPEEGLLNGVLVMVGGALLIAPGFISDLMGLSLMVPPVRRWVTARVRRSLEKTLRSGTVRFTQVGPVPGVDPFEDARRFDAQETPAKVEPSPSEEGPSTFRRPRSEGGEVDAEFTSDEEPRG
ncbi:FxsA family protein [Corallococcus exiguus]|uniref:FxsA family protein n=1 Tax=Corallococcus TaxID=83461 RepID=UPI000EC6552F|nr:FxsA family protein [Corallococcus sp. AB032C]NNB90712.1 FxsA family protein [Corallococcus exiguus]NNB97698.1 FxsA family protein [Corallococcus exiguus]NNC06718.1 FxsA family protein [Corallococcus exiguus]NPC50463.1 FxsA family protein [Corallococcus exiguus]RKH77572.1 FxsA family protein [Corallococcus sp. AB032C]